MPLQDPPTVDLVKAQQLFNYLEKLLPVMVEEDRVRNKFSLCNDEIGLNSDGKTIVNHRIKDIILVSYTIGGAL